MERQNRETIGMNNQQLFDLALVLYEEYYADAVTFYKTLSVPWQFQKVKGCLFSHLFFLLHVYTSIILCDKISL